MKLASKKVLWLTIVFFAIIILALVIYIIIPKLSADQAETINPNIVVSKIALFSSGIVKTSASEFDLKLPKGTTESFEILVENKSSTNYGNISLDKDPLQNKTGEKLSESVIDERVIHEWPQKLVTWGSSNTFTSSGVNVEELLVKNEYPNLTPPNGSQYNGDAFFSSEIGVMTNNLLKGNGYTQTDSENTIKTNLLKGGKKKFIFTITTPNDKVGSFQSQVRMIDKNNNQVIAKFEINLTIYDHYLSDSLLTDSGLMNGCYTNDQIPSSGATIPSGVKHFFVSESLFKSRLSIIKEHGCNSLIVRMGSYSDSFKMLKAIQESKISGPVIINHYGTTSGWNTDDTLTSAASKTSFNEILNTVKNNPEIALPILFYGIDEPNNLEKLNLHKTKADNIKSLLDQTFPSGDTRIIKQTTTSATPATWKSLESAGGNYVSDYPIINYKDSNFISDLVNPTNQGDRSPKKGEGYYFQGWNEVQKADNSYQPINRYLMGIGFLKSGLKRAFLNPVYGYQGVNYRPIYDDYAASNAATGWQKPMFTFYPASDGFIPTLQSESWREGVNDLKYYLEYQNIKDKLISELSTAKQQELSAIKTQLDLNLEEFKFTANNYKLPNGLSAEKLDETRKLMSSYLSIYYTSEPLSIIELNISDGQIIRSNPFLISVKVKDPSRVYKVEYYIDDNKICTSTLPDVSGNYDCSWDTSKYHSIVKIVVTDKDGNSEELTKSTSVELSGGQILGSPIINILPKTGRTNILYKILDF